MSNEKRLFPGLRPVILAAVAGLAAGAVAVYVTGGPSGNNGSLPQAIAPAPVAVDETACKATTGRAASVMAAATGEVAAMAAADPSQSVAGLAFKDPAGSPTTLAGMDGKVLLVNLWATWCAPCREEMPALDALQQAKGGDAFEVVAINVDTGGDEKPRKFLDEVGIRNLAFYRDATLATFNDLKRRGLALGLPVTLLVDRDGCLLGNMNGPAEWAGEDAKRLVEAALK